MSKDKEFEEEYEEVVEYVEEDDALSQIKKYGTLIVVALVVIVVGVYAYNYMNEQAEQENAEASKYLARVIPLVGQGEYDKALNGDEAIIIDNQPLMGLKEIEKKYSGAEAASLASFYAGKALLMQGNFAEAKPYFENAIDNESKEVRIGAFSGLAACLEESGNFAEASNNYENASELVDQIEMKSKYLYFAALTAEKAGKIEDAKKNYKKVVSLNVENAYSEYGGLSSAALDRVGTKID